MAGIEEFSVEIAKHQIVIFPSWACLQANLQLANTREDNKVEAIV